MRVLIAGSDSWHMSEYRRFRRLCGPKTRLINSYGISETTIDSTFFESTGDAHVDDTGLVPIGRPFGNTRVYILDARRQPVPVGVPGELYIGGAGVSRGYWGQPELTAERFLADPFSDRADARLYRTGDRGCYLADGNIAFLGRADTQVKLRGYRVELGEIESVLARHPAVHQAVVVLRADDAGPPRLAGYLVPADSAPAPNAEDVNAEAVNAEAVNAEDVRAFLRAHLPDYMVPSFLVVLDALPLTPSGKIDRRALPAPSAGQRLGAAQAVAPRDPTERELVRLWQDVLAVDGLGVFDDFFDAGGHSLLATQIMSRVNAAFAVDLPLRTVFEHPTVAAMAEHLTAAQLDRVDDSDLAGMLDELDGLSEDEAKALLGDDDE
jgi:acyl-CoA synthetase (AMP-forming)/AMP-acid ligase II